MVSAYYEDFEFPFSERAEETVEKAYRDLLKETDQEKNKVMKITISALKDQSSKTMSISKSCKTQIEAMKKVFKESNFTNASK